MMMEEKEWEGDRGMWQGWHRISSDDKGNWWSCCWRHEESSQRTNVTFHHINRMSFFQITPQRVYIAFRAIQWHNAEIAFYEMTLP